MLDLSNAFSGFSVDDIPAAQRFYGDVLGLDVTESNDILTLHLAGGRDVIVYPKGEAHTPASFTILNFPPVTDVPAAVAELRSRGRRVREVRGHTGADGRRLRVPRWRPADRLVHRPGGQRPVGHRRLSPPALVAAWQLDRRPVPTTSPGANH